MGFRMLADAVMLLHFCFIGYVVLGGFLTWRWPMLLAPHLLAVGWGAMTAIWPGVVVCPLTAWEDSARRAAGEQGLPAGGFIDHYLENVVYPGEHTQLLQALTALLVLVSWLGLVWRARRSVHDPAS
ncbi:MAG: DUF2784 domain-containing protein [Micromonosporaceae bacterium]